MTKIIFSVLAVTAFALSAPPPAIASEYTILNQMEILKPIDINAMNTEFQSTKIKEDRGQTVVVDIQYSPYFSWPTLKPDRNWQNNDKALADYLNPTTTANWDFTFQQQVLADLAKDGILPDQLDDVTLVQKVSTWLLKHKMGQAPFISYYVSFQNGVAFVSPGLRAAFDKEISKFGIMSDQDAFDRGLYGKGIYQNASAASCTPAAILWTTVFRALGIPTRIVVNIPGIDANDLGQRQALSSEIHDAGTLQTMSLGFSNIATGAFAAHTFNEVFVGGRWARLNYNKLDQPIVDEHYMGLLTQIARVKDWSDVNSADTWGLRYATAVIYGAQSVGPQLSSINPYRSLGLSDSTLSQ